MLIEIIAFVFAVVMIYFTHLYHKKGYFDRLGLIFWSSIWIGSMLLIIFNQLFTIYAPLFGVVRFIDLVTIIAFMVLFALMFFVYKKTRQTEKKIEKIVETLALKKEK